MKWRTIKYIPKDRDRRVVRRFAFLPKICEGGMTVWLETYDSHQEFMTSHWIEIEAHYLEVYL